MIFFWLPSRQAAVPVACEPFSQVYFVREVFDPKSRPQWHESQIQLFVTDC
jgi:mannitol-1-phosphate/altronate dehydrogenase